MPPLRERGGDVGLLASYFLDRAARRTGRGTLRFSPEAEMLLGRYDWPGNVRELENAVAHAVAVSEGPVLGANELPASVRSPRLLSPRAGFDPELAPIEAAAGAGRPRSSGRDADARSLDDVTREHVLRALTRHDGNATAAAKQLGVSRTTLWRMLKRWGIPRSRPGRS